MENLSETERQHIQNVLEKAEQRTPYVIKTLLPHQMTARTESSGQISLNLSQNSQDEDYDTQIRSIEDAIRKVEKRTKSEEKEEAAQQDPSKPLQIRDIDTEIDLTAVASREITAAKAALHQVAVQEQVDAPPQRKETREKSSRKSSLGSSIGGFKSFFGKASQAVMSARDALSADVQKSPADDSKASAATSSGELTAEELEHIQKIARLAEQEMSAPYPVGMRTEAPVQRIVHEEKNVVPPSTDSKIRDEMKGEQRGTMVAKSAPTTAPSKPASPPPTEITQEELEHINSITQMAMREEGGLDTTADVSVRSEAPVDKPSASSSSLFQFKPLTGFGMRAFKGVINKAEEAKQTLEGMTLPKMDEPAKSKSPRSTTRDETAAQLTQEELDHINRINQLAMQDEGPAIVHPGGADPREPAVSAGVSSASKVMTQPSAPSQPQQSHPASGTSDLTQEELDHINSIAQLAVQDEALSTPLISPHHRADADLRHDHQKTTEPSVPVSSSPRRTELTHIEDIGSMSVMGDKAGQVDAPAGLKSASAGTAVEETSQLTQEELEHIARINQMAMEAEAQLEAHPETTSSSFGTKPFTGFGLKTFKDVMHKADVAKSALEDLTTSKTMKKSEPSQVAQPSEVISSSRLASNGDDVEELTQEELDHINRIAQIAMQDGADQFPAQIAPMPSQEHSTQAKYDHAKDKAREMAIPEVPVEFREETIQLTQEELDHIARINQMAMEAEAHLTGPPLPKPTPSAAVQREIEQIPSLGLPMQPGQDDQLTQEELDHIARIAQLADQDQGGRIPSSPMDRLETRQTPSEEVSHIQQKPSSPPQPRTSPFGGFGLKTFKNVMSKAETAKSMLENVSATVRGQPAETPVRVAEPVTEKEPRLEDAPGLTQEELDHINRVTKLALQEETELTLQEHPHVAPLTPEEPRQVSSPETDEGPDSPASVDDDHYGADESAVDEHYMAGESTVDEHYEAERAVAEAVDEHLSPASSHESQRGSHRTVSRGSSGFDILSIPEMLNNPNLSQWYEEKLSFMKESIADEENEAETYSHEDVTGESSRLPSGYRS
ncbi:hypothetical protein ANCCEY_12544 [Ancylostoma ceylanicum]|uniref:Uncharacterized protein n=1 Tax=Ancylostoma ceylanicum TaxID=53326 RepID=A0A0D6LL81_9BILA|nr:hypothetical protein ANCCEY_12544 [Ancylostoma ceylanicum]